MQRLFSLATQKKDSDHFYYSPTAPLLENLQNTGLLMFASKKSNSSPQPFQVLFFWNFHSKTHTCTDIPFSHQTQFIKLQLVSGIQYTFSMSKKYTCKCGMVHKDFIFLTAMTGRSVQIPCGSLQLIHCIPIHIKIAPSILPCSIKLLLLPPFPSTLLANNLD